MNKRIIACIMLIILFVFNGCSNTPAEEELFISISPNEKYSVQICKTQPGATVDFSIKAYLLDGEKRKIIYNAYHEDEAVVIWSDNENISINNKTLNVEKGETYDWRDK
ncbi:MAG: DUF5412 family protein [Oscillospiraceae bacterium]